MAAAAITAKPVTLRDRLIVSNYLDDLYEQYVFSDLDKERLAAERDRRRQADLFIDILKRKPEEKIQKFFDIVKIQTDKQQQPHIYDEMFPDHRSGQELERLQRPRSSNRIPLAYKKTQAYGKIEIKSGTINAWQESKTSCYQACCLITYEKHACSLQ